MQQSYCPDYFEVIVVDNGSNDNTPEIVREFSRSIKNLKYIHESRPGLHEGRHAGLRNSRGEILVYGDDDIEAFPTWLEGIAESFDNPDVALVGGNIVPRYESSPPDWIQDLWQTTPHGRTIGQFSLIDFGNQIKEISPYYVYGCNFSIRKQVLQEIKGFHPDSMPDNLIKYRGDGETAVSEAVFSSGLTTLFNPRASVYHWVSTSRMTAEYLYKRGFLQGISDSYHDIRKKGSHNYYSYLVNLLRKQKDKCQFYYNAQNSKENPCLSFYAGYKAGFLYHQKAVLKDTALLNWVIRTDYL